MFCLRDRSDPRQIRSCFLQFLLLFLGMVASLHAGRPLEFLFDDSALDRTQGVRRVMGPVMKVPGPIFEFEDPWLKDDVANFSILYDKEESKFKMWYTGRVKDPERKIVVESIAAGEVSAFSPTDERVFLLYAESVDGLNWIRPALRRVRFNGSLENNILREWIGSKSSPGRDTVFWNVIKDPAEPDPTRRYKALGFDVSNRTVLQSTEQTGLCVAFSADGINWPAHPILVSDRTDQSDGAYILPGRDPVTGKWTMFCRPRTYPKRRFLGYSESMDFIHWTNPEILLGPEADDAESTEFYMLRAAVIAGWRIGAAWIFPNTPSYATMTSELVYAKDPQRYTRAFPRQPWIPLGVPGTFDNIRALPIGIFEQGNEIFIYYLGRTRHHPTDKPQPVAQEIAVLNSVTASRTPAMGNGKVGIGLVRMPWGHFSGLQAENDGMIESKWVSIYGSESVKAVADVADHGWIQAELVDHTMTVIPGFDRNSSTVEVDQSDHGKLLFKWKRDGHAAVEYDEGVSKLGHVIKIRFYLHRATLFGFQVGAGHTYPSYLDQPSK